MQISAYLYHRVLGLLAAYLASLEETVYIRPVTNNFADNPSLAFGDLDAMTDTVGSVDLLKPSALGYHDPATQNYALHVDQVAGDTHLIASNDPAVTVYGWMVAEEANSRLLFYDKLTEPITGVFSADGLLVPQVVAQFPPLMFR